MLLAIFNFINIPIFRSSLILYPNLSQKNTNLDEKNTFLYTFFIIIIIYNLYVLLSYISLK